MEKKRGLYERLAEGLLDSEAGRLAERFFARRLSDERKVLAQLYPGENVGDIHRKRRVERIGGLLKIVTATVILSVLTAVLSGSAGVLSDSNSLMRKDFGEGSYIAQLFATVGEDKGDISRIPMDVEVSETELSEGEIEDAFGRAKEEIEDRLKGDNESLQEVRSPLNLITSALGGEIGIEWSFDSYEVIDPSGAIREENTIDAGTPVGINAVLTYKSHEEIYQLYAMVYPPVLTEKEALRQALDEAVKEADDETKARNEYVLPDEIDSGNIRWEERKDRLWLKVFIMGLGIGLVIVYESSLALDRRGKKRRDQLLVDYPGIVEKLSLLIGAGMGVRRAFEKMAENYAKAVIDGADIRYAYEEMLICCYRMRDGVGEAKAIEEYGEKCGIPQYRKLSTLIVNNLKMGSEGLIPLMDERAREAFLERTALARQKGEEADTKLLIPMILLLGVTMVIVMVPGFFSFMM